MDNSKLGKLRGGTDVIIAPYDLVATLSSRQQACVLVNFITSADTTEKKDDDKEEAFSNQVALTLMAACYHSNQLPIVVCY